MNNLSEYIKQTSKIDIPSFPFDDDKLRSIIDNTESRPGSKKSFFTTKGAIIMSIIGIALFIGLSVLYHGETEKTGITISKNQDISSNNNVNKNTTNDTIAISKEYSSNTDIAEKISDETDENTYYEEILSDSMKALKPPSLKEYLRTKRDASFMIHPFGLSKEIFQKFNVTIEKKKLLIISEAQYDMTTNNYNNLVAKGYPEKGIYRKEYSLGITNIVSETITEYTGWSMDSPSISSPVFLASCKKSESKIKDFKNTPFYNHPLLDSMANAYLQKELTEVSKFYLSSLIETIYGFDYGYEPNVSLQLSTEKYPLTRYFCPFISLLTNKKDTTLALIWYPISDYLLNNVSKKDIPFLMLNGKKVNNRISGADINYKKNTTMNNADNEKSISGIEKLNLKNDELEKIGIKVTENKCFLQFESLLNIQGVPDSIKEELKPYGYNTSVNYVLLKEEVILDSFDVNIKPLNYTGWDVNDYSKINPILITGKGYKLKYHEKQVIVESVSDFSPLLDTNEKYVRYVQWDGNDYKPVINKLLPVHFTVGDSLSPDKTFNEYDVWFLVTKEFTELLPDRYRIPIQKELNIISEIESGDLNIDDACDAIKGKVSYFGLCSFSSPNIKNVVVSPNPAKDKIKIDFVLLKEIELNISLYNYNGTFVSCLKSGTTKVGAHSEEFILTGLNAGVYMIVLTDNHGSKIVQNLIINK